MKIAVLGAGISGLGSAYILSSKNMKLIYEKEDRLEDMLELQLFKMKIKSLVLILVFSF